MCGTCTVLRWHEQANARDFLMVWETRGPVWPPEEPPDDPLVEEYRAMYALLLFRLQAMDSRLPLATAGLGGYLTAIATLDGGASLAFHLAAPLTLLWFTTSTAGHARSKADVLGRLREIEDALNRRANASLARFQSCQYMRYGSAIGRTGTSAMISVFGGAAVCLASSTLLVDLTSPLKLLYLLYAGMMTVIIGRTCWRVVYPRESAPHPGVRTATQSDVSSVCT